jgi:hypothetical protein
MIIDRGKPVPVQLLPPQITHGVSMKCFRTYGYNSIKFDINKLRSVYINNTTYPRFNKCGLPLNIGELYSY